jgi:beta-phosphoglucomutase-like phosphatase (HAD superfamily)
VQILDRKIDLVIFDCDGVLVDSEVISCRAHAATLLPGMIEEIEAT